LLLSKWKENPTRKKVVRSLYVGFLDLGPGGRGEKMEGKRKSER